MVDADAVVLLPGAGLIIPERKRTRTLTAGADRVGQSEVAERAELLPRAWEKQRVPHPAARIAGIKL